MANICIFDAYGTLFDVMSAARMVANEKEYDKFSKYSEKVSNTCRNKQLEYKTRFTIGPNIFRRKYP